MNPQILRAVVFLNALLVVSAVSAKTKHSANANQTVRLASPCTLTGQHGVDRWPAKTDAENVPSDKSKITSITPSQVFAWPGVGVGAHLTKKSPRSASEQRWFALTGIVAGMKVEADGDIHIELVDANDNKTVSSALKFHRVKSGAISESWRLVGRLRSSPSVSAVRKT